MEVQTTDSEADVPEAGVFTYVQYIGKGMRDLGERRLEKRDLGEAWKHAPVKTCIVEFFERAEAVVGGEVIHGQEHDRSIGYGRDSARMIDDELDAEDALPLDPSPSPEQRPRVG
jgi:hypothetical protein